MDLAKDHIDRTGLVMAICNKVNHFSLRIFMRGRSDIVSNTVLNLLILLH